MRLLVIAPGRAQHPGAVGYLSDFSARIQRILPLQRVVVREGKRGRGADPLRAQRDEAAAMLAAVPPGALVVALDASGKSLDSDRFLDFFVGALEAGSTSICFLIGGPEGHHRSVLDRAQHKLSLSQMTLPHELAEVVLHEAIYRALTRWKGLPYHR